MPVLYGVSCWGGRRQLLDRWLWDLATAARRPWDEASCQWCQCRTRDRMLAVVMERGDILFKVLYGVGKKRSNSNLFDPSRGKVMPKRSPRQFILEPFQRRTTMFLRSIFSSLQILKRNVEQPLDHFLYLILLAMFCPVQLASSLSHFPHAIQHPIIIL